MGYKMKLWLDDIRRPPNTATKEWYWARSVDQAKEFMELCARQGTEVIEASLDHDMGLHDADPDAADAHLMQAPDWAEHQNGMDFVKWMVETGYVPSKVTVHSMNWPARENMCSYLNQACKHFCWDVIVVDEVYDHAKITGV